jgi:hypothetical protein
MKATSSIGLISIRPEYGQKFAPYMTAYHFFKDMPRDLLLNKNHENFYDKTAYYSEVKAKRESRQQ